MRRLGAALVAAVLSAGGVMAQDQPVVVELYTSQGCSACPPADALLAELALREDVIPLALHVDYWDYIGWKDIYANHAYTIRQKGYARAAGYGSIYTPQMIVGGSDHVVGFKPMKLAKLIEDHRQKPDTVQLTATRTGDEIEIRAELLSGTPRETLVQLVRYQPEGTVEIGRGENAGKTITYTNIVTEWQVVGGWDGTGPLDMRVAVTGDAPAVVILQSPGHRQILAAIRVK